MEGPKLLILGASIRAAAASCRRAGITCAGVDLFADEDTRQFADVVKTAKYPAGLVQAAGQFDPTNWMYTGGLENYPSVIEQVSQRHRLWGNHADVVTQVRNPLELHAALKQADLPTTEIRCGDSPQAGSDPNLRWLRKPIRSCGGMGITWLQKSVEFRNTGPDFYLQQYITGEPVAAVFLGGSDSTELLGVTRQLIGKSWTGAGPFQYAGSVGPVLLNAPIHEQVKEVGLLLANQFGLRGLFGVDGIVNDDGFWTIEVNPRYTASIEILERAGAPPVMAGHASVFSDDTPTVARPEADASKRSMKRHGKAIVFANTDIEVGMKFRDLVDELGGIDLNSSIADIPSEGTRIQEAHPICTIFAKGDDEDEVLATLQTRTAQVRNAVGDAPSKTCAS